MNVTAIQYLQLTNMPRTAAFNTAMASFTYSMGGGQSWYSIVVLYEEYNSSIYSYHHTSTDPRQNHTLCHKKKTAMHPEPWQGCPKGCSALLSCRIRRRLETPEPQLFDRPTSLFFDFGEEQGDGMVGVTTHDNQPSNSVYSCENNIGT